MNQSKVSARYYQFEDVLWETPGFTHLKKRLPIESLQTYASFIWAHAGGRGECPAVLGRRKNDESFYVIGANNDRAIHLAPKHRCLGGLLHEMAHALGHNDKLTHGPAFRKRCLKLYRLYGDWSGVVE